MVCNYIVGESPKLCELQLLKLASRRELRIIETVAPHWKKVAIALGFNQARIKTIEMGSHYQPEEACREIFSSWLNGAHDLKPVTWSSLIQCLKEAKLMETVDMLSNMVSRYKHEKREREYCNAIFCDTSANVHPAESSDLPTLVIAFSKVWP